MIAVFLADDHEIVRTGLRALIDARADMRVVGQAPTANETRIGLKTTCVDVLVLDLSLPDGSGVDLIREIAGAHPTVAIVVLTMYPEDQLALWLMRAGAAAYLNKSRPSTQVLDAIACVAGGGRYMTNTLSDLAIGPDESSGGPPHARLSARE